MKNTTMALLRLWLACSCIAISLAAEVNSTCSNTPNFEPGVCIPLPQCQELSTLLRMPKPLPASTRQLLRTSQCGVVNQQPLVCCRINNQSLTNTTTTKPATSMEQVPPPVDVSGHRNVALINAELCGQSSSIRIVGGNKAGLFEFPWMTLLNYQVSNRTHTVEAFKCGGSLISQKYVLTAGHCIFNTTKIRLVSVRLGEYDTATEEDCEVISGERFCAPPYQNINVEALVPHPQYNARAHVNDIALIRLAQPADTTKENVRPICLPVGLSEQTRNLDRKKLLLAGWGVTETGLVSTELLKVSLPVMPVEECHNVFRERFSVSINGKQMCAGGSNQTQYLGRGTGGGPLMTFSTVNSEMSMVQYGVVSYGPRHSTDGVPDVYTRVGHYMDWILDTIRP